MVKKRFHFKQIFLLVGMIYGITLGLNALNYSPLAINSSEQLMDIKTAAINNYVSDLNITWGGSNNDWVFDIALDTLGNIFITGKTTSFGVTNQNTLIAKFNSSGILQWNKTWGGDGFDYGHDIILDGLGNVYITGETSSFGAGNTDGFIAKYNSSGILQWNHTWGGSEPDSGEGIGLDTLGYIYITGSTDSFGAGNSDAFIAKYNSSGILQWNHTWGGTGSDYGRAIEFDTSGNMYITGGTSSLGTGSSIDAFIAKFNSTGHSKMNVTWHGSNNDIGEAIVLDTSGSIYIMGHSSFPLMGEDDPFILKFNSSGILQWNVTWGGSNNNHGEDLVLDASENIYLIGWTNNIGAGNMDAFIAKYNNLGIHQWDMTWGGSNNDYGRGIVFNTSRSFYIAGYSNSFSMGDYDTFIARFCIDTTVQDNNQPNGISGYSVFLLFGVIFVVSALIIRKQHKLKNRTK